MKGDFFRENVKQSFERAKEDIADLKTSLETLKSVISHQNEVIKQLSERLLSIVEQAQNPEKSPFFLRSIGNEGVNQSLNHSITQSLSTKQEQTQDSAIPNQLDIKEKNEKLSTISKKEPPNNPISPLESPKIEEMSSNNKKSVLLTEKTLKKEQIPLLGDEFQSVKAKIDRTFLNLSKQELKVFLTIYQLDEEGNLHGVSYPQVAERLSLTEQCIRGYISVLVKKGLPLEKRKINNKRTLFSITKDFRTLNLKQKLIQIYYGDPYQTTIFDIPQ